MHSLLVTGGAGFIGSNFVHYWVGRHPEDSVTVLDALTYAGNLANLEPVQLRPNFRFVQGDIRDRSLVDKLLRDQAIDTIVHFAAESHVDRSIQGPQKFVETNVLGTLVLLEGARAYWFKEDQSGLDRCFHHISTDEVYGSLAPGQPAFDEQKPYAPNSPYAATKAASDHLVRAYHHTYGLPVTISNCSNNYGPYQFPEKLIPLMILNALQGKQLPIYGDGLNIRDWLFVEDHIRGIELVLKIGRVGETYNIGGRNEWSNIDLVRLLCGLIDEAFAEDEKMRLRYPNCPAAIGTSTGSLIKFVTDRPGHDRHYAMDPTKATEELGYQPNETFETGIRKTLWWYLENETWCRTVRDSRYRTWTEQQYGNSK